MRRLKYCSEDQLAKGKEMSKTIVKFEIEKETKNSIRYAEIPEAGKAPIVGSLYVQKWFAGNAKSLQITIELDE